MTVTRPAPFHDLVRRDAARPLPRSAHIPPDAAVRRQHPLRPARGVHRPPHGFGAVIFAGGYRPDYHSWLPWPAALDDLGFPIQADGASTVVDDLYFIGVPFLRNRKSSLLIGVGDDATVIADTIAARAAVT